MQAELVQVTGNVTGGGSQDTRDISCYRRHMAVTDLEHRVRADAGERPDRPIRRVLWALRRWMARHTWLERTYRIVIGITGGVVTVAGLLLVPLPGPGWLIVFIGLAILGTEFRWARRAAAWTKRQLKRFWVWWRARRASRRAH